MKHLTQESKRSKHIFLRKNNNILLNAIAKNSGNGKIFVCRGIKERELFRRLCIYFDPDDVADLLEEAEIASEFDNIVCSSSNDLVIKYIPASTNYSGNPVEPHYDVYGDGIKYAELFRDINKIFKVKSKDEALRSFQFHDGKRFSVDEIEYLESLTKKRFRRMDEELAYKMCKEILFISNGIKDEEEGI